MNDQNLQEQIAQLDAELEKMKQEHPEQYLELLKTLNKGIQEVLAEKS